MATEAALRPQTPNSGASPLPSQISENRITSAAKSALEPFNNENGDFLSSLFLMIQDSPVLSPFKQPFDSLSDKVSFPLNSRQFWIPTGIVSICSVGIFSSKIGAWAALKIMVLSFSEFLTPGVVVLGVAYKTAALTFAIALPILKPILSIAFVTTVVMIMTYYAVNAVVQKARNTFNNIKEGALALPQNMAKAVAALPAFFTGKLPSASFFSSFFGSNETGPSYLKPSELKTSLDCFNSQEEEDQFWDHKLDEARQMRLQSPHPFTPIERPAPLPGLEVITLDHQPPRAGMIRRLDHYRYKKQNNGHEDHRLLPSC